MTRLVGRKILSAALESHAPVRTYTHRLKLSIEEALEIVDQGEHERQTSTALLADARHGLDVSDGLQDLVTVVDPNRPHTPTEIALVERTCQMATAGTGINPMAMVDRLVVESEDPEAVAATDTEVETTTTEETSESSEVTETTEGSEMTVDEAEAVLDVSGPAPATTDEVVEEASAAQRPAYAAEAMVIYAGRRIAVETAAETAKSLATRAIEIIREALARFAKWISSIAGRVAILQRNLETAKQENEAREDVGEFQIEVPAWFGPDAEAIITNVKNYRTNIDWFVNKYVGGYLKSAAAALTTADGAKISGFKDSSLVSSLKVPFAKPFSSISWNLEPVEGNAFMSKRLTIAVEYTDDVVSVKSFSKETAAKLLSELQELITGLETLQESKTHAHLSSALDKLLDRAKKEGTTEAIAGLEQFISAVQTAATGVATSLNTVVNNGTSLVRKNAKGKPAEK